MLPRLIKETRVTMQDRQLVVRYYDSLTAKGTCRCSCEIVLGSHDVIILDDDSLDSLESRVLRLLPATVHSHHLATRAAA